MSPARSHLQMMTGIKGGRTMYAAKMSPARAWLAQLWESQRTPTQINQRWGMQRALQVAIEMRLRFDLEDFAWMATNTRPSYCDLSPFGRSVLGDGERVYRLAIEAHNMSAILAIEHWKQRPPFLWAGKRLFVGRRVWWPAKNDYVRCTSFKRDGRTVMLCQFTPPVVLRCPSCLGYTTTGASEVLRNRYTLTPAQVRAAIPRAVAAAKVPL